MAEFGNNNVDLNIWGLFHILKDNTFLSENTYIGKIAWLKVHLSPRNPALTAVSEKTYEFCRK